MPTGSSRPRPCWGRWTSFIQGRAALGALGSVLTTCGSLAAYRAAPCREHLPEYVHETFLGARVQNGDDRKLTQYCLLRGKVVFQETFVGWAALPASLGHLVRQRTRWFTSFYRGSLWMLCHMPRTRLAFWLTVVNVARFLGRTGLLAGLALVGPQLRSGRWLTRAVIEVRATEKAAAA